MAALLDCAPRHLDTPKRGPEVALRDIAEHAGVNFGLIYRVRRYEGADSSSEGQAPAAAQSRTGVSPTPRHLDEALAMLMTFGDGTSRDWSAGPCSAASSRDETVPRLPCARRARGRPGSPMRHAQVAPMSIEDAHVASPRWRWSWPLGWRLFGSTALSAAGLDGATLRNATTTGSRAPRRPRRGPTPAAGAKAVSRNATGEEALDHGRLTCSGTSSWLKCPAPTV